MNTASTRAQGDTPAYVRVYRYGMYSTLRKKKIRVCGVWRDPACHDDWVGKILSSTMEHDLFAALLVIPSYCS